MEETGFIWKIRLIEFFGARARGPEKVEARQPSVLFDLPLPVPAGINTGINSYLSILIQRAAAPTLVCCLSGLPGTS